MSHSLRTGARWLLAVAVSVLALQAHAQGKPNILIIMGDDIGITNISKYSHGLMGYQTPNIDRIGHEGMMFTDYYGEQSCTAGRSAFITGQSPMRTGLTKVGLPGSPVGLQSADPTLAELLKPQGYMTGQFGKNHLGDLDKYLPTNHGFDVFFGNLYHLDAEEAAEDSDWGKNLPPAVVKAISPRGVIRASVDGKVEDLGPLTKKRMETVDDEFLAATLEFIDKAKRDNKPFFAWFNSTRMHFYTHINPADKGLSGQDFYNDAMVAHDRQVGVLLKKLDDLGLAKDTIVLYTTDNGVHYNMWPDGGITPFRGEKNTNWEGAFRVPALVRWPGHIKPNSTSTQIMSHLDWVPTLMSAAGVPDIKTKLLTGYEAGAKKFNVHLDGYDFVPYLEGKTKDGPRKEFFYFSDDGKLLAQHWTDWKLVFAEQRSKGFDVWRDPFVDLRAPKMFNLRRDPFERADIESANYNQWWEHKLHSVGLPMMVMLQPFLATFQKFPPRQRPASFTVDQMMEQYIGSAGKEAKK